MDIPPLPVQLVRQDPSSDDCGRCCALMLLNFLDDKLSQEEVWHKLHVYKKHSGLFGSYLADIGSLVLSRGHHAVISHCDWHWWDKPTVAAVKKSSA